MNEFEKFERKKARRLAYLILFDIVLTIMGGVSAAVDFAKGEVGWGIFWVIFTPLAATLYFFNDRARLRKWAAIHRPHPLA